MSLVDELKNGNYTQKKLQPLDLTSQSKALLNNIKKKQDKELNKIAPIKNVVSRFSNMRQSASTGIKRGTLNKITNEIQDFASNPVDNTKYIFKAGGSGIFSGTTGIAQAPITDAASEANKGKEKDWVELADNSIKSIGSLINPMGYVNNAIKAPIKINKQMLDTLKNKDKNPWEKVSDIVLNNISEAKGTLPAQQMYSSTMQNIGKAMPNASEELLKLNEKVGEPAKKLREQIAKESENYDGITNFLAGGAQSIGNMVPSIATFAVTKNPNASLAAMGLSVKGQATQEALDKGMDIEKANQIGDAKMLIEVATEKLTGGTKIFGKKGTKLFGKSFDDLADDLVKYGAKSKFGKFLMKQLTNTGGEILEEEISDILGNVIDKGTTDPDRKIADWRQVLETAGSTAFTTTMLNLLTGGMINDYREISNNMGQYRDANTGRYLDDNTQNIMKQAENIINQNQPTVPINNQQNQTQNQQILPTQQITQQNNNMAQNENMEQISKEDLLNKSNELLHKGEVFVDDRYAKGLKSKSNIIKLENVELKTNKILELRKLAQNLSEKFINTKVLNEDTNIEAKIGKKGIKESTSKDISKDKVEAIGKLPEIIREAVYKNSSIDTKEKNNLYHYLVALAQNGNDEQILNYITLKETPNGTKFHYNTTEKIEDSSMTPRSGNNAEHVVLSSDKSSTNNIIPQNNNNMQAPNQPISPINNTQIQENKTLNPTEISNMKLEDVNTTPVLPKKHYNRGNKESSFYSNITQDSKFLNEELRKEMANEESIRYYNGITNAETLEKAYNSLSRDGKNATLNWFNKDSKNANAEDIAKGWILLKQYQDAGNYQSAVEVAKKMRDTLSTAGQTVQAANILSRLTPEGMFYYAQSELSEAYNKAVEGKSKKWIDENADKFNLTPQETQTIMDTMKEVSTMEDGREKKIKLAEIQKLVSDKIPPTAGQSIKAWMRISMLLNPKTLNRNFLGNAVVLPVNVGSDFISSGVDKMIAKKTGVRTTGNINVKNYAKGFGKGLFESYDDFRRGINTREIQGNKFEIGEGKSFNDKGIGEALNRLDNVLNFALDAGDRPFYEATFTNSINNQLVLNNTTEVTQDMIDIATNEALQRTWQDDNAYTKTVLDIRKNLNKLNVKGYGLGDVLIPFAKTPANLTKAIVDYSPVGLTKALTLDAKKFTNSLNNGQYSPQLQHKFVQSLGKGMAGSLLYVLGYGLAKSGIASGESDDDKDVKNFMKNSLGISSYSIKIGDKSFTYDWAQPVAVPLAIMTNYVKYSKDNPDAKAIDKAIKSMNIGTEQLLEQSFMESLNTVLNGNGTFLENLSKAVMDLPARAIPTFSKQIADMVDGTQRTSFEYGAPVKSAINSAKSKIPFVSKTLPIARDTFGNEIQKYGGDNNLWNVMLNPANVNKGKLSKAGKEIYELYKETGEKNVFPVTAPYYINSKGEKVNMTAEQRSEYQKVTGKYTEKAINGLLADSDYKKLSNEKKAKLISEIISDSNAKAKYDVLKIDTDDYGKLRKTLQNIDTTTYYDYKFKTKDMKKDKEKTEALINSNYNNKEKSYIYENYIKSKDKEDTISTYEVMKKAGLNINEWLKYEQQEFESDKKEDGTVNGKSVSGSKKQKVYNYINSANMNYNQRLLLLGTQYKLNNSERKALVNYVNNMQTDYSTRMKIFSKIKGVTVYKNGTIKF